MLFMQAVVVSALLAQGGMDQRSPFGNNAPDMNDLTPTPRMVNPPASTPGSATGAPADSMSNTRIPPPPSSQPDAGPPPPAGTTTTTPGTAPAGTGSPGGTLNQTPNANRSSAAPSTPAGMPDRNPAGNEPGAAVP